MDAVFLPFVWYQEDEIAFSLEKTVVMQNGMEYLVYSIGTLQTMTQGQHL